MKTEVRESIRKYNVFVCEFCRKAYQFSQVAEQCEKECNERMEKLRMKAKQATCTHTNQKTGFSESIIELRCGYCDLLIDTQNLRDLDTETLFNLVKNFYLEDAFKMVEHNKLDIINLSTD